MEVFDRNREGVRSRQDSTLKVFDQDKIMHSSKLAHDTFFFQGAEVPDKAFDEVINKNKTGGGADQQSETSENNQPPNPPVENQPKPPVKRLQGPALRLAAVHGMVDEVRDLLKAGATLEASRYAPCRCALEGLSL